MSDNAEQLRQKYKELVTDELKQILTEAAPKSLNAELSKHSEEALDKLSEFSLRPGKRVRGSLAAYAYDFAAKTSFGTPGLRAGAAIELAQSYLLIVDDVMDKSELRRGKPTLHELYRKEEPDQHLADMMAINLGLVAQHVLNLVMISIDESPENLLKALQLLHRNVCLTGFGQMDDLYQRVGQEITEDDVVRKYAFKSSYYTFVNPLHVGLALGGISDQAVFQEVEDFGLPAGIAFQLKDDVLGVFGDSAELGKSNLDDIREGKYTLLLHHALSNGNESDVNILRRTIGNPKVTDQDLSYVQDVFERTGARAFVEGKAAWYAERAKAVLDSSNFWDQPSKALFAQMVDYSVKRTK